MSESTFSPWLHWGQRSLSPDRHHAGVYVLGRLEGELPALVDPFDRRILLIAETHGQSLDRRWDQFHHSAFQGRDGHAGGLTFHRLFCSGPDCNVPPWLYLAASTVPDGTIDIQA